MLERVQAALRESFAHTPSTLALVWQSSRSGTLAMGLLTLLAASLPVAAAWIGKHIVDAIVAGDRSGTLRWVLAEFGVMAALALVARVQGVVRSLLGGRLGIVVHQRILQQALRMELRHFENPEFYDQLSRARKEASGRPIAVVAHTFALAQTAIGLLGFSALLFAYSPWAVAGLLLAALPATVAEMRFSTTAFRLHSQRSPYLRKVSYLEHVLATDTHAKEVKLFGLGPTLLGRYSDLAEGFYQEDKKLLTHRTRWTYGLSLLGTAAFYGSYATMAAAAALQTITLGQMSLYVAAFRQGQQAFQGLLSAIGSMYEDSLYMSNLFRFLALPTMDAPQVKPAQAAPESARKGIVFEHVSFRYPGKENWALEDIHLELDAGCSIALVGHNGAGKTTFIKLLTRLYRPTLGRILLDGRDLQDWDETELRSRIGVIFQDYNRYQLSVRENVGFGSVAHVQEEPRVLRAAERGGASELVHDLPRGLDTQLGKWFSDGQELSGGQWQKLAIARAFMREEADILVLDEPTAALDAQAESVVFERFRELTRGRTAILISHRFPTVRMADRILVIEGGRVIEQGTHSELVASGGRYAELFALQASGYR